jgi:hypothetical protein
MFGLKNGIAKAQVVGAFLHNVEDIGLLSSTKMHQDAPRCTK